MPSCVSKDGPALMMGQEPRRRQHARNGAERRRSNEETQSRMQHRPDPARSQSRVQAPGWYQAGRLPPAEEPAKATEQAVRLGLEALDEALQARMAWHIYMTRSRASVPDWGLMHLAEQHAVPKAQVRRGALLAIRGPGLVKGGSASPAARQHCMPHLKALIRAQVGQVRVSP